MPRSAPRMLRLSNYGRIYKNFVTPEKLSRLLKEGAIIPLIYIDRIDADRGTRWWCLIGQLITCTICSKKAVITPYRIHLPIEKNSSIPCHCAIEIGTGKIRYHWCNKINRDKEDNYTSVVFDDYPNHFFHVYCYPSCDVGITSSLPFKEYNLIINRDVCKSFETCMRNSYRI